MKLPRASIDRTIASLPGVSRWSRLALWKRRAIKTIAAIVALVVVSSVVYHSVMVAFEGRTQRYSHSLQVVIETYTGTGYGSDSPWESPVANALVSVLDLSTFLLLFIVVPYVFRPVLENALSPTVPTMIDRSDHIVVCGIEQQGTRLIEEFETRDVEYVVVTESEEAALDLVADGFSVVHGDPTAADTLRNASIADARAVVVDTRDDRSASAVLAVRDVDEALRTVVLVETLERERHLRYAGADRVVTPRHLLGERIAERVTTEISPTRSDSIAVGEDLSLLELTVFEESPIRGESIGAIERTASGSIGVVGLWREGSFVVSPDPETEIEAETVLLVAGRSEEVRELEVETYRGREREPSVIVAGHGLVGSTVRRAIAPSVADCTVVDIEDDGDVDVVGDVTEEEVLLEAGIEGATIVVVAIGDDDEAILSVLLADELGADADVIARMNDDENDAKARRAGATYVLSLPEMSGRVLAREVLDEALLSYRRQLKAVRIDAGRFAGGTVDAVSVAGTDCAVVAVERDGKLLSNPDPDLDLREDDAVVVVGTDEAIDAVAG